VFFRIISKSACSVYSLERLEITLESPLTPYSSMMNGKTYESVTYVYDQEGG
jgi:hypothetical protein